MTSNPHLDELAENYVPEDFGAQSLATLAIAHELREMNRLTAAINAPVRFAANVQAPISPEDMAEKVMAIPDDSGDARIAAAARRWAEAYGNRNMPGRSAAAHHLAAAELLEAVYQEDNR